MVTRDPEVSRVGSARDSGAGSSFDDFARALASGTFSRRRVLGFLGAAVATSALASPGVAWGRKKPRKKCKKDSHCPPGVQCMDGRCGCSSGDVECGGVCCVAEFCCGGTVCCGNPNKECVDGECRCKEGRAECEGDCCNEGLVCLDETGGKRCCPEEDICEGLCCAGYFEAHACCNGACCPEGENCTNGQCGCGAGSSCPAGESCVPATGTCCPTPRFCPTDFSLTNAICCPEGTECTGNCSSHQQICVTECCPLERVCGGGGQCCPEGTVCRSGACV